MFPAFYPIGFDITGFLENMHSSCTVGLEKKKGFRLERRKPFVFLRQLVAGVRFELTTFGL
jgi:hypothetical protein